jgi:hypothetical protein
LRTLNLPIARTAYDRQEEQVFRDHVRRAIGDSLGKNELPQYSGVPFVAVNGSNAAWSAPTGATPTKVPFNTLILNTSLHTFDTTNNIFTIAFNGIYRFYFHLFHNAGGAVKKVDIAACAFKNTVEVSRNTVQRELDQIWNIEGIFIAALVTGDIASLRVAHTETVAVNFDLTYSRLMMEQLTPNPSYVDKTRV